MGVPSIDPVRVRSDEILSGFISFAMPKSRILTCSRSGAAVGPLGLPPVGSPVPGVEHVLGDVAVVGGVGDDRRARSEHDLAVVTHLVPLGTQPADEPQVPEHIPAVLRVGAERVIGVGLPDVRHVAAPQHRLLRQIVRVEEADARRFALQVVIAHAHEDVVPGETAVVAVEVAVQAVRVLLHHHEGVRIGRRIASEGEAAAVEVVLLEAQLRDEVEAVEGREVPVRAHGVDLG
jgi:hypothetical protein